MKKHVTWQSNIKIINSLKTSNSGQDEEAEEEDEESEEKDEDDGDQLEGI